VATHRLAATLLASALLAAPALAQTSRQTNDSTGASNGAPASASTRAGSLYVTADGKMRAGKMVGATVYNDQDKAIGSIDDILWDPSTKSAAAIISVGGFLGVGAKLVSVPYDLLRFDNKVLLGHSDQLKLQKDHIVIPGATEASLKGLPGFHYGNA
jgi:sporulation protein YlmC with PRC-barrel domain